MRSTLGCAGSCSEHWMMSGSRRANTTSDCVRRHSAWRSGGSPTRREAVAYTHNDDHRSHAEILLTYPSPMLTGVTTVRAETASRGHTVAVAAPRHPVVDHGGHP